jgi:hypothetical protein
VIPDKQHIPTISEMIRREASLKKKDRKIFFECEGQPRFEGGVHIVQGGLPELGRH